MAYSSSQLLVFTGICLQFFRTQCTDTIFMSNRCGILYRVDRQLKVSLRREGSSDSPDTYTCNIMLRAPEDYRLHVTFDSIDIVRQESVRGCTDYVNIYDGLDKGISLTGKLCGSGRPDDITSTGNEALITFYSTNYGVNSTFQLDVSVFASMIEDGSKQNLVFILIAVATGVIFLAVAIGMCCCVYTSRKKERERRIRRRQRRETLQLQMTLELSENVNSPAGPPATPEMTAPAYTPACAPPPYSTLPRRHSSNDYTESVAEISFTQDTNIDQVDHPPPYDEHM